MSDQDKRIPTTEWLKAVTKTLLTDPEAVMMFVEDPSTLVWVAYGLQEAVAAREQADKR
jgi:hypothetical protein